MPEPLKNMYNPCFFEEFTTIVKQVLPNFKKQHFLNTVFDTEWEAKELKKRMRHIAYSLKPHLPGNFKENIACIIGIIKQAQKDGKNAGFEYMFFPDFIEQFGLDDLQTSLTAMEFITTFASCEFAIRPFLLKHPNEVMDRMLAWSKHTNHHVRRFSSEGCRPRLPWAMAIPQFKKDPSLVIPILENLRNDSSLYVRKSVANNLNDIAKDNPEVVTNLVKKWKGKTAETDWIIKHGCRTLLKQADKSTYEIFGLNGSSNCAVTNLKLSKNKLKIGERLGFSFNLNTLESGRAKLRIEYAIFYMKASGKQIKKLFKLTENYYETGTTYVFNRQQRFQDFTTRKHYPGKHKIAIVVNGQELAAKDFRLIE